MQLGFVSAILADCSRKEVLDFAESAGFDCVELMCWPKGKAERRYAGVTHIDCSEGGENLAQVKAELADRNVKVSALGYYPNLLSPNPQEREISRHHLLRVIDAAAALGIFKVNTFIGRNPKLSIDENWQLFLEVWPDMIHYAESRKVRIGIENCPMFFSNDEWPGGKNLAFCPAIWRRMFEAIDSPCFGLNYDPSHLVWQQMDPIRPIPEFASKIFHVHAKDVRIDREQLNDWGILAVPLTYHAPKLPGLGDVDWGRFFSVLGDCAYSGPVCIEVEDRAYEQSLASRQAALKQSMRFLKQYMSTL
ncbi:MAG: sugar phosphate isomerase/epimerase [Lentisphaerae bacterium]|nr:MAG: sugar phosphate isomerase/epimerase [Lentisphaerota bacterium]